MPTAALELEEAVFQVSRETGIPMVFIMDPHRQREIAEARHKAMRLLREKRWTVGQIAGAFKMSLGAVRAGLKHAS